MGLLLVEQALNGLQLGVTLFLLAAGLTLVLGIMRLVNLAHGALYMIGAYIGVSAESASGSFLVGIAAAVVGTALIGAVLERVLMERLYKRSFLEQVIVSFGLIMFFEALVRLIWGPVPLAAAIPDALDTTLEIVPGLDYSAYRLLIIAAGLTVALLLYVVIVRTRIGMLVRAGASNRRMVAALGVDIRTLYMLVFAAGSALAAAAGMLAGPVYSVQIGMGDQVLIESLVVIVIGGIGSIRGAAIAAILVGIIDTSGRVLLPSGLGQFTIYLFMALVLFWRPRGLFPAPG